MVKIKDNTQKIKNIFKNNYKTKAGILGGISDKGITTAYIGLIQEFGSIINNIPPRSFIIEPLKKYFIVEFEKHKELIKEYIKKGDIKRVYEIAGIVMEQIIIESFNKKEGWKPNSPITIQGGWMKNKVNGKVFYVKGKGVNNPLINTGTLRKSIKHEIIKNDN